MNSNRYSSSW